MFQITKFTLSDRIYPIEYTNIRIEDILWPKHILRVSKFGQYDGVNNRAPSFKKTYTSLNIAFECIYNMRWFTQYV